VARHPQVRVRAPEWEPWQRIRVDRDMAPLLRELWRRGYLTIMSCQDWSDSGSAWIVFGSQGLARRFCYETVGLADELPDGWRTETRTWPHWDEPVAHVWFPAKHLAAFNERKHRA